MKMMLGLLKGFGASARMARGQRRQQQGGEKWDCVFHGDD
jgi:hypothetical protein